MVMLEWSFFNNRGGIVDLDGLSCRVGYFIHGLDKIR